MRAHAHRSTTHVRLLRDRETMSDRLYAWWWWRSPNSPHITDRTYIELLDSLPETARGLDVGSRQRIRPNAITLDVVDADGVDIVGDAHDLPFPDFSFDYVWCNAVLEHVRDPRQVAKELIRVLKPDGLAFVQVPFLEYVHGWPSDYYRFTLNGLREIFSDLEEVAAGTSAGPGQVLPDLVQYYATAFGDVQSRRLWTTVCAVIVGTILLPLRLLDRALRNRPSYWQWARAYYYVGRRSHSITRVPDESTGHLRPLFAVVAPNPAASGWDVIMGLRTKELMRSLQSAGAEVTALDARADADVDFVVAPNMNYFLFAGFDPGAWTPRRHLSTYMLWDDPLGALALRSLSDRGGTLGSQGPREVGVLEKFRAAMSGPLVRHYAWDSGHIEAVTDLGLADPESITWYAIATFRPFLEQGRRNDNEETRDLAFSGNVYASARQRSTFTEDPFFAELSRAICDGKVADLAKSSWELLNSALDDVPKKERAARGLVPDESPFWDFYLYNAWYSVTTAARVDVLSAVDRNVHLYGMFADPESVELLQKRRNLVYAGNVHHFRELPQIYASTKINVCIANGLIYKGVPSKLIDCLASGGFALSDPKDDLIRLFGRDVEAIFFRNADELNAKIEYFLPRRDERREIVHELRKTVDRECTLDRLFERVLQAT